MITVLCCIAFVCISVIIGVIAGTVIVYLRDNIGSNAVYMQYPYASCWYIELWDIGQGLRLSSQFRGALTLGRGQPGRYYADVFAISLSDTISREQCVIYEQNGRLILWNLSDVNPTLLNGQPLEKPEILEIGDRIAMGGHAYLLTDFCGINA